MFFYLIAPLKKNILINTPVSFKLTTPLFHHCDWVRVWEWEAVKADHNYVVNKHSPHTFFAKCFNEPT